MHTLTQSNTPRVSADEDQSDCEIHATMNSIYVLWAMHWLLCLCGLGNLAEQTAQFGILNTRKGISASLRSAVGKQLESVRNFTNATLTTLFDGLDIRVTELNVFDRIGGYQHFHRIDEESHSHTLQACHQQMLLTPTPVSPHEHERSC